jgi:hypothetical protein
MTADVSDPATASFVQTGATGCAACYATPGSDLLQAQAVELCSPRSNHPNDYTHCALVMSAVDTVDRAAECEAEQLDDASRCIYVPAAPAGARGFSDDDSSSASPCEACAPGFYVNSDGVDGQCLDFDECAHDDYPCENGAVCNQGIASFTCTCSYGFSGNLCQLLDECALSPCQLSAVSYPLTDVDMAEATNRFLCPVSQACTGTLVLTTYHSTCCRLCSHSAHRCATHCQFRRLQLTMTTTCPSLSPPR